MILQEEFSKVIMVKFFFTLYSLFAVVVSAILYLIAEYLKKNGEKLASKVTRIVICVLLSPVILGIASYEYARYIEPNWITVSHISVKSPYFNPELKNIKIVQVSDLHITEVGLREERFIKAVNALKPDLLIITGDFVNNKKGFRPCAEVLARIHKPRYGIIGILGNHDTYFINEDKIVSFLNKAGVVVLRYSLAKVDFGNAGRLWLVGISNDYGAKVRYGDPSYLIKAFETAPCNEPKILLVHHPEVVDSLKYVTCKPQLVLAGHTHGGQFGISFLRKFSGYAERSKYMAGWFKVEGVPLYVNRGIGVITRPIRFFAPPEVTVVRLVHSEK